MHLLEVESFGSTFGKKSTRKKAKISANDYEALIKAAEDKTEGRDQSSFLLTSSVCLLDLQNKNS